MSILVVPEPPEPSSRAGLTAPPIQVEAVDPHGNSLELRFNVVPVVIVEVTAQLVTSEGNQIAALINEKL